MSEESRIVTVQMDAGETEKRQSGLSCAAGLSREDGPASRTVCSAENGTGCCLRWSATAWAG